MCPNFLLKVYKIQLCLKFVPTLQSGWFTEIGKIHPVDSSCKLPTWFVFHWHGKPRDIIGSVLVGIKATKIRWSWELDTISSFTNKKTALNQSQVDVLTFIYHEPNTTDKDMNNGVHWVMRSLGRMSAVWFSAVHDVAKTSRGNNNFGKI